jgi:phospholipid/cholesterol/gamma-HCH transport system permease protein
VDLALRGQDPVASPPPIGLVRQVGSASINVAASVIDLVRFIGELSIVSMQVARNPRLLRVRDTIAGMSRHGTDAVPVVSLLGLLIGTIIAFQTFDPMAKYGAKLQVADVVAISIVRELGPLITAIILAGRSGSAFAAEIGTMKVTQELDALRTFGIDAVRFLVIPRILAVVLVTPLLSVYATLLGVAGGFLILGPEGFTLAQYLDEVRGALDIGDFLQGLAKAAVFALLVGAIGCLAGMRTGQGPGAVGLSTTRAVVAGIVAIVVADAVLGSFFYALGI